MNGFRSTLLALTAIAATVLSSGCATGGGSYLQSLGRTRTKPVWLVSNGFHSAIGLRREDAGPFLRQLGRDRGSRRILIGWGQQDFFFAKKGTLSLLLKATFPSESALHAMPLRQPFPVALPHSDIIRLQVTPDGLEKMVDYIDRSFARDGKGQPISLGPGYFATSEFYRGRESFYFPKTCNVWTARALREAGLPLFVPGTIVASELVWQVERHGKRIAWKRVPVDGF